MLTISFAGDLCFQGLDPDSHEIDETVRHLFRDSDLSVVNLESPLTVHNRKRGNQPCHLKGRPRGNQLIDMFDVFSLANNHILDYGKTGLVDTCRFLSSRKKSWFGAGTDAKEACRPLCIEKNQIRVAFMGCTRWYNAGRITPGTCPDNKKKLEATIRRLKKENYFIIVFPHWNYEYVDFPSPADRLMAHQWISAGADLIVGSHPHQIQGVETWKGKQIFHSLGNFIFNIFDLDQPRFSQTFIPTITIDPDHSYTVAVQPVYSTATGTFALDGPGKKAFEARLNHLSKGLGDKRVHRRLFYQNCDEILRATMGSLEAASNGKSGFIALLKRLPRVRAQDIHIKLYSLAKPFRKGS